MLVVKFRDKAVKKQLQVREVLYLLMAQFIDKPTLQRAVIGLDLAVVM